MRVFFTILVFALLAGCAAQEVQETPEVVSEMPVPGVDVKETIVTETTEENTDLTTSENTFDAIDEAISELW